MECKIVNISSHILSLTDFVIENISLLECEGFVGRYGSFNINELLLYIDTINKECLPNVSVYVPIPITNRVQHISLVAFRWILCSTKQRSRHFTWNPIIPF